MSALLLSTQTAAQTGGVRGVVYDEDYEVPPPLSGVRVQIAGSAVVVTSGEQGNYAMPDLAPGTYNLVFSKSGYVRQVRPNVVVKAGAFTELDVSMPGDFTDMDEFIVEDVMSMGGATEEGLLELRFDNPALLDSIGADLMSRAGAGDAASALKLVSGASVEGGKFAVIRGLPDRYVSSQLNGLKLPSADEDKRAVELDQFPAAVIESIQVSKTFTPDQQGDASGGAVNVLLKGIPEESVLSFRAQTGYNSQVERRSDFLTYEGGGLTTFGFAGSEKDVQTENLGDNWDGAVGVSETDAPIDYKFSLAAGGKHVLDNGVTVGGFASLFYERDSSFFDDGINDSWWSDGGVFLTPEEKQQQDDDDFKTALFDITQSARSVQWGGLGTVGAEWDEHRLAATLLFTHTAEDKATLAEDTRGKEYFFPGHDPLDPFSPGAGFNEVDAAPYIRTQTLEYTERTVSTFQLTGEHNLSRGAFNASPNVSLREPTIDWTVAYSTAELDQPDKRLFGTFWKPEVFFEPIGQFFDPFYSQFKPAASFTLGNLQRIYKNIEETSQQGVINVTWPLEQWDGEEGSFKLGAFADRVTRDFNQDTFSNFADLNGTYQATWDDFWSDVWQDEDHPVSAAEADVDYSGDLDITSFYAMIDFPLSEKWTLVTGARFESTDIQVINDPEDEAFWFPPGALNPVQLFPGDADAFFQSNDFLPSIGLQYELNDQITLRGSWSKTVARQTFKELTPIIQQEFLGGPIFIGFKDLQMSSLDNFDLRADYRPYDGGLISLSVFHKEIEDPIEYVQDEVTFTFITPRNYPDGQLSGIELEIRQNLGEFWDEAQGLAVGGNATFIDSEVTFDPEDAATLFAVTGQEFKTRDMLFAPEYIYNLYATYDFEDSGTQLALFYTVKGDTLVAGAGESINNFVPDIYAEEFGTLNFSLSQRISDHLQLKFQAQNLTNPRIREVYRADFLTPSEVTRTSFTRGRDFSIGLTYTP